MLLDLGVNQLALASILCVMVFDYNLHGATDGKTSKVWEELEKAYSMLGTPSGERLPRRIFEDMFVGGRLGNPSKFKELHAKAAIARHLGPALNIMMQGLGTWAPSHDGGSLMLCHAAELLQNLSKFYDVIMYEDLWLSDAGAKEAHDCLQAVGAHHQRLCHISMQQRRKLFMMTEKAHYLQHMALDLLIMRSTPRINWVYADEDLMGRVSQVASKCTRARGPLRVTEAFFTRYRQCLFLRWRRCARERLAERLRGR